MLSKAEWDFDGLPHDQVEECWTYEFSRECPELKGVIEEWRQGAPEPRDFESLKRHAGGRKTQGLWINGKLRFIPFGAYFMFPEWPKKPFQEIDVVQRRKRLRALLENEKSIGLPQSEKAKAAERKWRDREGSVPNLREIEPCLAELGVVRWGDAIRIPCSVFDTSNISKESTDQIVVFRIQWDLADKQILNRISKWLKAKRPRLPLTRGSVGGSDPLREKKKALEYLGKVRIVHFSNGDYLNVFADQPQWIKCRKAVTKIISERFFVS